MHTHLTERLCAILPLAQTVMHSRLLVIIAYYFRYIAFVSGTHVNLVFYTNFLRYSIILVNQLCQQKAQ